MASNQSPPGIFRRQQVLRIIGVSASTLRRMERAGTFPPRVRLGKNSVGWRQSDINEWMAGLEPVDQQGGDHGTD